MTDSPSTMPPKNSLSTSRLIEDLKKENGVHISRIASLEASVSKLETLLSNLSTAPQKCKCKSNPAILNHSGLKGAPFATTNRFNVLITEDDKNLDELQKK